MPGQLDLRSFSTDIDKIMKRTVVTEKPGRGRPLGKRVFNSKNSYSPPEISTTPGLQEMKERHHEITRLALLGYKNVDIAHKLSISEASVKHCLNSPMVKMKLDIMRGDRDNKALDLMDQIKDILPDAVKLMESVIDGGMLNEDDVRDRTLQVNTAKHLLEIGGISPVKRIEQKNTNLTLTSDDIKEMVAEAKRLGMAIDSDVVDAEFTEE